MGVPARIGRYAVEREIGRGGMERVFLVRDPELDRRIAIKVLPDEVARDAERLQRFRLEAQTLASLNHPGIVTIHSVEEDRGLPFVTMELVEGATLDALIAVMASCSRCKMPCRTPASFSAAKGRRPVTI